ncbi:MAG: hypothetical protein D6719_08250 [Candidatus Dadabacteria bacterium]|nr:MAG: hypothetical protein D6719_08250 [Candidatus Dadabacteria bacterium]
MPAKRPIDSFIDIVKRCYEIGNTPLWYPFGDNPDQNTHGLKRFFPLAGKTEAESYTTPRRFTLSGTLTPGENTRYACDGQDFKITASTWIIGDVIAGARAEVEGRVYPGKGFYASKICVKS